MKRIKILVVDDSEVARQSLSEILLKEGHQVFSADSGSDAIHKAKEFMPDIIFMDIVMESMDGFQACRKLKSNQSTSDIPVVMVTSKDQPVDRQWALRQGASSYIVKPYSSDQIGNEIRRLQH